MGSLVAELAEKLSSATNNFDIDEGTIYVNTSADTVAIGGTSPDGKFSIHQSASADIMNLYDGTDVAMSVLDGGNVLIGGITTAESLIGVTPTVQVEGLGYADSSLSLFNNSNDANGAYLYLGKSRGTSLNSDVIVQDGDTIGGINWVAADGVDRVSRIAGIFAAIDGTPGADDTPGELTFYTTADGAQALGSAAMVIKSTGKVGIGASAPAANLHVFTETDETDEGTDAVLTLGSNTSGKMRMYFGVNDAGNYTYIGSVESAVAYRNLILQPNGGRVGIGTTTAPSSILHVATVDSTQIVFDRMGANATGTFLDLRKTRHASTPMGGTALSDNDVIGHIRFMGDDGNSAEEFAGILARVNGTVGNADTPGELVFRTTPDGSATPSDRMIIINNGDVGIGVSTPSVRLDVFSTDEVAACFSRGADTDTYVTIRTAEVQNRQAGRYHIAGASASSTVSSSNSVTGTISKIENSGGTLKGSYAILTNRGDSLTEGFKVDEDGNHFFKAYATGNGHIAYWNHQATYSGYTTETTTVGPSGNGYWFSFGTTNFYADVFLYGGKLTGGAWKVAAVRVDDGGYHIGSGTGTTSLYNGSGIFTVNDPSNTYTFSNNGGVNQLSVQRTSGTTAYDLVIRTYGQYVG